MVIQHEKCITFRCPECGLGNEKMLSMFELAGQKTHEIKCKHCGSTCVTVQRKADKLLFAVLCVACMEWHSFTVHQKFFWGQKLTSFRCPVTGFGLLCIGEAESVHEAQSAFDDEMLDVLGELEAEFAAARAEDDYPGPDNEQVMFPLVDKLYALSKNDRVICPCGSKEILFDILNDRVHIFCETCGRDKEIMALTEEDLEKMLKTDEILLGGMEDE